MPGMTTAPTVSRSTISPTAARDRAQLVITAYETGLVRPGLSGPARSPVSQRSAGERGYPAGPPGRATTVGYQ